MMKRAAFSVEKPLEKITFGYTFNHDRKTAGALPHQPLLR